MKISTPSLSPAASANEALDRHLSLAADAEPLSNAEYLSRGAALITLHAVAQLRKLRPQLYKKIEQARDSSRLRARLWILAKYFEEGSLDGRTDDLAYRETVFALLYFLKGFDRIPDSIPEIGLLDDALIVQTVLQQHAPALRAHWLQHGRTWPAEL